MTEKNNKHHVAWADRIGLNKTWAKSIERIWATYGTDEFYDAVWGMRTIIINIKNGPQLKKEIDKYVEKLYEEKNEELKSYYDTYAYDSENMIRDKEMLPKLAYFMIQLLEDHGFGFYKSKDELGTNEYIELEEE